LNYFINKYPLIKAPLAIFSGGTGNDFAWKLYGKTTVDQQIGVILQSGSKPIDVGICNGRYFINGFGIGFDGEVVKAMGSTRFLLNGHLSYLFTVLKKIIFYIEKTVNLELDGKWNQEKIFMISVANGSRYGGGFLVAPNAEVDDGEFDTVVISSILPWKRFFYLPKVQTGKHVELPFVKFSRNKEIIISSDQNLFAHVDGELIENKKFVIKILPRAMHFRY